MFLPFFPDPHFDNFLCGYPFFFGFFHCLFFIFYCVGGIWFLCFIIETLRVLGGSSDLSFELRIRGLGYEVCQLSAGSSLCGVEA